MKTFRKLIACFGLLSISASLIVCRSSFIIEDEHWQEIEDMSIIGGKWATMPKDDFNYALSVSDTGAIEYWGYNRYYTTLVYSVAGTEHVTLAYAWQLITQDELSPFYIMDEFDPTRGPTPWSGSDVYAVWQTLPPSSVEVTIYINDSQDQIKAVGMIDGIVVEIYLGPRGY
jgi:hypothetical protein